MPIRALLIPDNGAPEETELDDAVEGLQAAVGGYFELFARMFPTARGAIDFWCNEDGRTLGLAGNLRHPQAGLIVGPIVVTAARGSEVVSLTDEEVAYARARVWEWLGAMDRSRGPG